MKMETNGFGYTKMTLYALKQRLHTLKNQLHTLTNRLIVRLINGQCMQCMQKLKIFFTQNESIHKNLVILDASRGAFFSTGKIFKTCDCLFAA